MKWPFVIFNFHETFEADSLVKVMNDIEGREEVDETYIHNYACSSSK